MFKSVNILSTVKIKKIFHISYIINKKNHNNTIE